MLENSQKDLKTSTKNYTLLSGKSRIDSLNDRIKSANEQINEIIENPNKDIPLNIKKAQVQPKTEENKVIPPSQTQKLLNEIISDENNKSIQVGLDNNNNIKNKNEEQQKKEDNKENNENQENKEKEENQENKEKVENQENKEKVENQEKQENIENKDINDSNKIQNQEEKIIEESNDIDVPFIKKTKLLINELKKLKEKAEIKEDDLNNEVSELPKRGMLELSLSDFKIKKKCDLLKKELDDKNNYIKTLENEIVSQRVINTNLKKSESEYLLKISALEDEIRVMKMKLLGYNTSEQYNTHHNHELYKTEENNCGHVYGEQLVQSMWIKDNNMTNIPPTFNNANSFNNLESDFGRPIFNTNNERRRLPPISHSHGNLNRMIRNNILNMNNEESTAFKTENRMFSESKEKNVFNNYTNNGRYDNYRLNNDFDFSNGGNNFQRVSEMILKSPNKRMNKNFRGELNRFRIKIHNNNIINSNINNNNNNNNNDNNY